MKKTFQHGKRFAASLITSGLLSIAPSILAAEPVLQPTPAAVVAPASVAAYDLATIRHIALEKQPAVHAAHDSLAAAEARCRAVANLRVPTIIQRDLPIRRHQASLGVTIAQGGVTYAEWEAVYAVTRNYFSMMYAREQLEVADKGIANLKDLKEAVDEIVKTGSRADVTTRHQEKLAIFMQLSQGRRQDAVSGIERATAALYEAMGVGPECGIVSATGKLPIFNITVNHDEILSLALSRRGEMIQAGTASEVVGCEVAAQGKSCMFQAKTFASASDIHAQQVPQGVHNGEYRPGALSLEMPALMVGSKHARVEEASALHARAGAVVEKTRNLITLEAEDAFSKWQEATNKASQLQAAADAADKLQSSVKEDFKQPGAKISVDDVLNAGLLASQARLQANESVYQQLLALTALERITAGGFAPGFDAVLPAK